MNILPVIELLQAKINSAINSSDVIYLSKAIETLNVGTIKTVSTYSDLLSITPKTRDIYFVEDEKKLYYFYFAWVLLFDFASLELRAWGNNLNGRLGDGTVTSRISAVSVVGGFTDWVQTSAGGAHSLGVRTNGSLWAWGLNTGGRLGDSTTTARSSPVSVVGGFTDWTQASAGDTHSIGVRANGTLWAWGNNGNGRLGDGTVTSRLSPVLVVGGFTDWIQASSGRYHSLGVRTNGSLWAWGSNAAGRLGDNTVTSRLSPVSVVGGFSDWVQSSAGGAHSLGVRANGTLWAWGANLTGRLGDDTLTSRSSPVSVVGGFTDWTQASAGYAHSLGVRANGTLWAWGLNTFGRLGDGTTTDRSSPVSVVGGFTDWIQASAGGAYSFPSSPGHSIAIRTNGTAWAWGYNSYGQLGDGSFSTRNSPVSVVGDLTSWIQASAGRSHSLAVRVNTTK
jgi:hypothetical protein